MGQSNRTASIAAFKKLFHELAPHKHRYDVFRDFVTMAACSLHNAIHKEPKREAEYMSIIGGYKPAEQAAFPKLLGCLIEALDDEPRDILGPLYMELEIASKDQGQFFTPPEVSEMMARLTFGDMVARLEDQPFVKLSEPACGAGGMVLAFVKVLSEAGHNPADRLWVQCIDVDRLAALMCYIQLSLWNVPAEVVVGNTLSLEVREVWHTPAHHFGFWSAKLKPLDAFVDVAPERVEEEPSPKPEGEGDDPVENVYETFAMESKGQALTVRWCPDWSAGMTGHLEIISDDRSAHPISETGYRSHFAPKSEVDDLGGPVAYVSAWLETLDDGKAVQLSLF